MRVTLPVLLVLGCVSFARGLPAIAKQINDEVEFVPLEKHNPYGDQPIIDTGAGGFGSSFENPFGGLFENLESMMTRIRQQMESLLRRFPGLRGNSSDENIGFRIGGDLPPFPQIGDIDLGKGNTTSVTKVIDGHKVVINETEYKKEDDFGGAFFKVRIIDVQPDSSELTTDKDAEAVTPSTTAPKDTESIENSLENEITKGREARDFENIERFDEVDAFQPFQKLTNNGYPEWGSFNDVEPIEPIEDNSIVFNREIPPYDLSSDTYVNQIMADAGAPTNPDAEVFFVDRPLPIAGQPNKIQYPR